MNYFILINNVQQGPFTLEELRQRGLTADTLVWAQGMSQWTPAWQVEELRSLVQGADGTPTPPPPPPFNPAETAASQPAPNPTPQPEDGTPEPQRDGHKALKWAGVGLLALLVLLGVTRPNKAEHQQVINENLMKALAKSTQADDADPMAKGWSMLGQMVARPLVNEMLTQMLDYHNYVFFSTTTIQVGKNKTITTSYGLLSKVFTSDEEKIASAVSSVTGFDQSQTDEKGRGSHDDEDSQAAEQPGRNDRQTSNADTTSLSKQIGDAIIDHVGKQVKKEVSEHTDSTTSSGIGALIDDIIRFFKGE